MDATVLIVDDSWIARLKIGEIVKSAGYKVIEAGSGKEGLSYIEGEQPDIVLLDLLMPEMSGNDVLKILGEKKSAPPVIVITADIQETTRSACLREGAVAVVNKPPKRELLLREIQNTLEAKTSSGGS